MSKKLILLVFLFASACSLSNPYNKVLDLVSGGETQNPTPPIQPTVPQFNQNVQPAPTANQESWFPPSPQGYLKACTDAAVYREKNTGSKVEYTIPKGAMVQYYSLEGEWVRITYDDARQMQAFVNISALRGC